jgi:hypothetical protein
MDNGGDADDADSNVVQMHAGPQAWKRQRDQTLVELDEATRDLHAAATIALRMVWSARDRLGLSELQ